MYVYIYIYIYKHLLEAFLRRELRVQLQKERAICFDKIAPCDRPRTAYCNHLAPPRSARGFLVSDPAFRDFKDRFSPFYESL